MGEFERQDTVPEIEPETERTSITIPPNCCAITAQTAANVWQVAVKAGDQVQKCDLLVISEAMKMEIAVLAEESGIVREIYRKSGQTLSVGEILLAIALD
jgi:urea carboxylase